MDSLLSRRSVLAVLGAELCITGGCLSIPTSSDAPRLSELSVQNKHGDSHAFEIQALADGTVRSKWSYEAGAATYQDGELHEPTGRVWTDPLESSEDVTLRARIDDGAWESYSLDEYSGACLRVEAEVETDGFFQLEVAACDRTE